MGGGHRCAGRHLISSARRGPYNIDAGSGDGDMAATVRKREEIVVDIGRATDVLRTILSALTYRNLDDEAAFRGRNTTAEFLARVIFDRLVAAIDAGQLGAVRIESLRVTLHESHVAAASYDGHVKHD